MTPIATNISRLLDTCAPLILYLPIFLELLQWITFLRQPTAAWYIFSIFPETTPGYYFYFTCFAMFEFGSRIIYLGGATWTLLMHILPTGLFSLWAYVLMSHVNIPLSGHIYYFRLIQVGVAHAAAVVGRVYLPILAYGMATNCIILVFSSIRFAGKVDTPTYLFYLGGALLCLCMNQALLFVNGSIYDMSQKYLKHIRLTIPVKLDKTLKEKVIKKQVASLNHTGVALGPLPCAKTLYAIQASDNIFSYVVNLLIAFK